MYIKYVDIPMFKCQVGIVFHNGPVTEDVAPFNYPGFNAEYGGNCAFLCKPDGSSFPFKAVIHVVEISYRVLVHEAVHAVNFLLHNMGSVPSYEDDEVQAYLVEYIVEQCEEVWDEICSATAVVDNADELQSDEPAVKSDKKPKRGNRGNNGRQKSKS